ncbi:MAG: hypothetical protein WC956_07490 [bacterium]
MPSPKIFKYDVLIDAGDLCDRKSEQEELLKRAKTKKHTILFAPRRYGKTSLIKNVVGEAFSHLSGQHLVLFFDLMDVQSLESIAKRFHHGISLALAHRFPVKKLLSDVSAYLKGFSLQVDVDPATNQPSISLAAKVREPKIELSNLIDAIKRLAHQYPTMLILDEFHDITFVPEAEALFRGLLQELGETAVFILGSKRHLMTLMFQDAHSPLFHYGDETHLGPIPIKDWMAYFQERLAPRKIKIDEGALNSILTTLCDVPNAICEFGAWLVDNLKSETTLTVGLLRLQMDRLVENKQSYAYLLQGYTEKECGVMSALAKQQFTLEPQSEAILKTIHASKSSVAKIIKKLMNRGLVEYETDKGYRLSDPLLGHYLATR